jgi:RecA/RadA recombinase
MANKKTTKGSGKGSDVGGGSLSSLSQKVSALSKAYKSIGEPEFVKTGSLVMDALLGGGVPRGSFILWSSHSGIGKSTGSLFIAKSYCAQGLRVLYLDFEGGVNQSQLSGIGLMDDLYDEKTNPNGSFYCFRVQSYADAETFLDALLPDVDLVVVDSITSVLPEKIKTQSVENILPGLQARLMANLLLKYKAESMKNGTSWIMINQMRTHIRFVGITTDEEAGGNALKFFSDYRVMMKEAFKGKLERDEITPLGAKKVPYGSVNEIWCLKSRYSRPFIPLKLGIVFGKGISNNYAYYDFLNFKGCVRREGSWYSIDVNGEGGKVQGENAVIEWINDNRDIVKKFISDNGGYKLIMDGSDAIINDSNYKNFLGGNSDDEGSGESVMVGDLDDGSYVE